MVSKETSTAKPPRPDYPLGVPGKFDKDGNVQPFAGNTVICHLSPSSHLYTSMLTLQDKLKLSPLSHLYTLLPPSSWHMTVFEGVCDQVRKPDYWPSSLPLDAPLADCHAVYTKRFSRFDLRCDPPYLLSAKGFDPFEVGIGIHVEPRTAAEAARLRALRNRLSDTMEVRHQGHDVYGLHFSVAYLIRHLDDDQKNELLKLLTDHLGDAPVDFELGAPEFCTFENMSAFKRQFYLEDQDE